MKWLLMLNCIAINKAITISNGSTIDTNKTGRIVYITSTGNLNLINTTLTNGNITVM